MLPFRLIQGRDCGEVEFAGEFVDGTFGDFVSFGGDLAVVEVEEVERTLTFVGADLG